MHGAAIPASPLPHRHSPVLHTVWHLHTKNPVYNPPFNNNPHHPKKTCFDRVPPNQDAHRKFRFAKKYGKMGQTATLQPFNPLTPLTL